MHTPTPRQRRRIVRWVILVLIAMWIIILAAIAVDLVALKKAGPPVVDQPERSEGLS